jgi:hypothetical protein
VEYPHLPLIPVESQSTHSRRPLQPLVWLSSGFAAAELQPVDQERGGEDCRMDSEGSSPRAKWE